MNYKELKELIKDKPDNEEVMLIDIKDLDTVYYTIENYFMESGELLLSFFKQL